MRSIAVLLRTGPRFTVGFRTSSPSSVWDRTREQNFVSHGGVALWAGAPKVRKHASPGQRPGKPIQSRSSPERAGQVMERPFRARSIFFALPRALPWAGMSPGLWPYMSRIVRGLFRTWFTSGVWERGPMAWKFSRAITSTID